MTLTDIWDALSARGAVAMTIAVTSSGFQVSARTEGSGWTVAAGEDLPSAVRRLIETFVYRGSATGKTRYFSMADGRLVVTWNGGEPLAWEGPRQEVTASEWAKLKESMEWSAMI